MGLSDSDIQERVARLDALRGAEDRRFVFAPGRVLTNVHSESLCKGQACVIHAPSEHHMRSFPLNWRADRRMFERVCPCGVGHPDPDHMSWFRRRFGNKAAHAEGIHGCCGCCKPKKEEEWLVQFVGI